MKKIVAVLLLLFVGVGIAYLIFQETHKNELTAEAVRAGEDVNGDKADNDPAKHDADVDIVYYFMTTQRCPSCMKIEAYSYEAVAENFKDRLTTKKLVWKMVNLDEPQHNHFIKDYDLFTKSVVLVKIRNGSPVSWKNLDKVWTLLGDKNEFITYVTEEVESFLGEG